MDGSWAILKRLVCLCRFVIYKTRCNGMGGRSIALEWLLICRKWWRTNSDERAKNKTAPPLNKEEKKDWALEKNKKKMANANCKNEGTLWGPKSIELANNTVNSLAARTRRFSPQLLGKYSFHCDFPYFLLVLSILSIPPSLLRWFFLQSKFLRLEFERFRMLVMVIASIHQPSTDALSLYWRIRWNNTNAVQYTLGG